jgi:hypothetical protein
LSENVDRSDLEGLLPLKLLEKYGGAASETENRTTTNSWEATFCGHFVGSCVLVKEVA